MFKELTNNNMGNTDNNENINIGNNNIILPKKNEMVTQEHMNYVANFESGLNSEIKELVDRPYGKVGKLDLAKITEMFQNLEKNIKTNLGLATAEDSSLEMYSIGAHIYHDVYARIISGIKRRVTEMGNDLGPEQKKEFIDSKEEIMDYLHSLLKDYIQKKKDRKLYNEPSFGEEILLSNRSPHRELVDAFASANGIFYYDFQDDEELMEARREKTRELIDTTIDFIVSPGNDMAYLDSSKIGWVMNGDRNYAVARLLKTLKDVPNMDVKRKVGELLFRLEFKQLGITEEGVQYLDKIFDLRQMNNPDFHVKRLTAKAEFGIFNEKNELSDYYRVNLEDLLSKEKIIRPEINEFVYETLFFGRSGETEEEKSTRDQHLKDFKKNYYGFYDDEFWEKTGIQFNNLNFKEQGWFLDFYKQSNKERKKELMSFARDFGEKGLKSFLSLEIDRNNGERILKIADKLEEHQTSVLFSKVSDLADLADHEVEELAKDFYKREEKIGIAGAQLELLRKVHDYIVKFEGELEDNIEDNKKKIAELLDELHKQNIEISLLTSVLKAVKQEGEKIDFEIIKNLDIEVKNISEDLKEKEKEQVIEIATDNWIKDEPEIATDIIEGLKKNLTSEKIVEQTAYVLKYQGNVIGFVRFDPTDNTNEVYAGSLNIYRDLRNVCVGKMFMDKTLKREAERNVIKAETSLINKANSCYVENYGFVIDGFIPNSFNTGRPFFTITLDKAKNEKYEMRNEGKDEPIKEESIKNNYKENSYSEGDKNIILKYSLDTEFDEYIHTMKDLLCEKDDNGKIVGEEEDKYVITRYFIDPEDKKNIYIALEKL